MPYLLNTTRTSRGSAHSGVHDQPAGPAGGAPAGSGGSAGPAGSADSAGTAGGAHAGEVSAVTPGPLQGQPLAFAHRGAYLQAENTRAAFARAVDLGFRYIETDVRTAACGTLVVFHDEVLDRVTTGSGSLSDHTWEELSQVRVLPAPGAAEQGSDQNPGVDSSLSPDPLGEPLMTFDQLLEAFPETHFNVDLKDAEAVEPFCAAVQRHQAWDRVLAASFNDLRRHQVMQRLGRRIAASAGVLSTAMMVMLGPLGLTGPLQGRFSQIDCLQVPVRQLGIPVVTPAFIARCHRAGLQVHVWVVDDPRQMRRLLDMGVDGLMTDDAAALAQVMRERGHWPQALSSHQNPSSSPP